MKQFLLVLSIFISQILLSQDTTTQNKGLITFKSFSGYFKNDLKLKSKELKKELYTIPAAIPFYKKAQTNKIICYTLFFTMASFALLGRQNTTTYPYKQHTGFKIAGIISGVGVFYFLSKYSKNIKKAVRLYNE